jgi:8-oxo-dGTP pyrophosphatase MutT (NUDIX family)
MESPDSPLSANSNGWFRQQPYFAAFSNPALLQSIMHHQSEPNNIKQNFNRRILRLVGTQDPFKLFLDLERIKKKWFYAQDTRQISKRKKFTQYILDTHLLEMIYPKLQGKIDLIRMIINIYRQIQQEAFGIVLINKQNKVFLVQNEKYYWSFPKGKLKLNPDTYTFESQWSCALREFGEEVNIDLSSWLPSQYWEARLADNRMVGLFVIENFDETNVHFEYDKREIIDIMWFNLCTNNDEMHTLRQYWKEQQRLTDPYYTALPFIEHLIFEYLPHKEKNEQIPSSCSIPKDKEDNPSSSENSVIDKLLGRLPLWPSPPSSISSSPVNDADLELLNLFQQQNQKDSSELNSIETNRTSLSIVDRLNEAIRQAQCNNNQTTTNTDHRIAVQA